MRCLIVGAGSIGVYLGCKLEKAGDDIILVGRRKLKKVKKEIVVEEKICVVPKKMFSIPKNKKFDFIFVASKIGDVEGILKKLKIKNCRAKYVVGIQNGFVDHSTYKKYLGKNSFVSVSVFEGFRLLEDQLIVSHSKKGWKTNKSQEGKVLCNFLNKAKIKCSCDKDLNKIRAEKMIVNCTANVISATEKKTFYELVRNKKIKKRMDNLFEENYNVMSSLVKISSRKKLKRFFYKMIKPMKHYSSTCQDVMDGRRTEINYFNKFIVKKGHELGIDVSENEKLVREFRKKYK